MGLFVAFICVIFIAVKIFAEQKGMGKFYRSVGDKKRASEADTAVGCAGTFLVVLAIMFILVLLGVGQ